MKVLCAATKASGCTNTVDISFMKVIFNLFRSGGTKKNISEFCPEHLEWSTFGRKDDGDPTTNPQFNKK